MESGCFMIRLGMHTDTFAYMYAHMCVCVGVPELYIHMY